MTDHLSASILRTAQRLFPVVRDWLVSHDLLDKREEMTKSHNDGVRYTDRQTRHDSKLSARYMFMTLQTSP